MRGTSVWSDGHWSLGMLAAAAVAAVAGAWPSAAQAVVELPGLRNDLPGQGYLQYSVNPAAGVNRFGEELTGWMDVRHPLLDGVTTSVANPYDRSNHFINTNSIVLKDSTGVSAAPDLLRDWDRSSKIYAQAGISTPRISSSTAQLPVTWANFDATQRRLFANAGTGRALTASTANLYYAKSFSDSTANGVSIQPLQTSPGSVNPADALNSYSYLRDGSADSTMPHELGHQLLNGNALWNEDAIATESNDPKNWMYKTGSNYSVSEIGRNNGRIEGVQTDRLYANGGANNPGFVQRSLGHEDYGNHVDWDYVQDDSGLEARGGAADDHAGSTDSLFFAPGITSVTAQPTHDHAGLGSFATIGDFTGKFRYADVFSLNTRYSDFDRSAAAGDFSARNGALDYLVYFLDAHNNVVPGTLDTIFDSGWTDTTTADDYLARWLSPVDAVGMFVFARPADGIFDGNAQIDAVIVAPVPEPTAAAALLLFAAGLVMRARRGGSTKS